MLGDVWFANCSLDMTDMNMDYREPKLINANQAQSRLDELAQDANSGGVANSVADFAASKRRADATSFPFGHIITKQTFRP